MMNFLIDFIVYVCLAVLSLLLALVISVLSFKFKEKKVEGDSVDVNPRGDSITDDIIRGINQYETEEVKSQEESIFVTVALARVLVGRWIAHGNSLKMLIKFIRKVFKSYER